MQHNFLSIVIPAYNEEKRIGPTLESYAEFFREKVNNGEVGKFEILVVLNACRDNTLNIVKNHARIYPEIRFLNFLQGGKGFAIIEGFKNARGSLIGFVDADMATPPEAFHDLVCHIEGSDGIIASRWMKGSIIKTPQTLLRKITSRGFHFLVRVILGLPFADTQCGAKLFTRKSIEAVLPEIGITRWAFDIDLLFRLKKKGFAVKEIPTIWEDKKESKLNLTHVPFQMFSAIVRLRLLHSPFNFFVRLYDRMPEAIKIHHHL